MLAFYQHKLSYRFRLLFPGGNTERIFLHHEFERASAMIPLIGGRSLCIRQNKPLLGQCYTQLTAVRGIAVFSAPVGYLNAYFRLLALP